uniref:Peptidase C1A papain C-terminal domain-containing protein n=1 Tax=viral metagenome TaxID=1070528 RepID=A0A6C0LZS7_9ZZZZ
MGQISSYFWHIEENLKEEIVKSTNYYGWKKDLPDRRDYIMSNIHTVIPNKIDLRVKCPNPYNQGKLGSCTANAIAFAYQFDELNQGEKSIFIPSRLFIYYNERYMEGTTDKDTGAAIRDGIKSINKIGVCPEKIWPYDIEKFTQKPDKKCYNIAKNHKSIEYHKVIQNEQSIKHILSEGFPIVFGFAVYESFESKEVAENGVVPLPKKDEKILGGHAVALVGYTTINDIEYFIVRNSWGTEWGDKGYCYFPVNFICDSEYCDDFWVIKKIRDKDDNFIE